MQALHFLFCLTAAPLGKYALESLQIHLGMNFCTVGQHMSNGISVSPVLGINFEMLFSQGREIDSGFKIFRLWNK